MVRLIFYTFETISTFQTYCRISASKITDEEVQNENSKGITSEIHFGFHFVVLPSRRPCLPFVKCFFFTLTLN